MRQILDLTSIQLQICVWKYNRVIYHIYSGKQIKLQAANNLRLYAENQREVKQLASDTFPCLTQITQKGVIITHTFPLATLPDTGR